MKGKIFLQFFIFATACTVIFSLVLLFFSQQRLLGVDVPKTDVPYIDGRLIPKDSVVLFVFEDGSGAAVELLFEKQMINVLVLSNTEKQSAESFGYSPSHTVSCDYSFLIEFIDTLGGIETESNDGYALTGVQAAEFLSNKKGDFAACRAIIEGVLNKISKNGFSTDLLYCIIENTNTTLSAPACYGWVENLKYCAGAYNIIDGR